MSGYKKRKTGEYGKSPREVNRIFLLVCDDKETSPIYFKNYNDRKSPLKIVTPPSGGKDPLKLVQYAKKLLTTDYNYINMENGDVVWCVFDRDCTPNDSIIEAQELAEKSKLRICFSNPCFELWFLLHYNDYTTTIGDCDNVICKLEKYICNYKKNVNYYETHLKPRTNDAVDRAKKLCEYHKTCGINLIERKSDPSTQVYTIIEEISKYTGCLMNK